MPLSAVEWVELGKLLREQGFIREAPASEPWKVEAKPEPEVIPPERGGAGLSKLDLHALGTLNETIRENTSAVIRLAEALAANAPKRPGRPRKNAEEPPAEEETHHPHAHAEPDLPLGDKKSEPPPAPSTPTPMFKDEAAPDASQRPEASENGSPAAPAAGAAPPPDAPREEGSPQPSGGAEAPAPATREQQVKAVLRQMQQRFPQDSLARITTLLKPYNAKRFSDLSPEHYDAVLSAAQKELARA